MLLFGGFLKTATPDPAVYVLTNQKTSDAQHLATQHAQLLRSFLATSLQGNAFNTVKSLCLDKLKVNES